MREGVSVGYISGIPGSAKFGVRSNLYKSRVGRGDIIHRRCEYSQVAQMPGLEHFGTGECPVNTETCGAGEIWSSSYFCRT